MANSSFTSAVCAVRVETVLSGDNLTFSPSPPTEPFFDWQFIYLELSLGEREEERQRMKGVPPIEPV